jgi:hypothetical protein
MDVPTSVKALWDKWQASIAHAASPLLYEAFHFDDSEGVANASAGRRASCDL